MSELILKPMETEEEIRGKAYVHWKSWQESYPGIVDAGYLARLTLEKCEALARAYPDNTWVAKLDDRVVGFAACGPDRDNPGSGEVYALYVLEAFQKQKIGWRLMRLCLEELRGCGRVFVWVLAGNAKAIRFYERVGFCRDGTEKLLTLGTPVKVLRMSGEREKLPAAEGRHDG
jgi:ribosomal protein S18 acetylase RimI-like enzyme